MKYGWALVLMGCTSAPAKVEEPRPPDPPTPILGTAPWKVGRSVLLRVGPRSYQRITVASVDECGTWVESTTIGLRRDDRVRICIAPTASSDPLDIARVIEVEHDGHWARVAQLDRPLVQQLAGSILPHLVSPTPPPTGRKPPVVISYFDGTRVVEVIPPPIRPVEASKRTIRGFFGLGAGYGWLGGGSGGGIGVDGASTGTIDIRGGMRITPRFDAHWIISEAEADYSPDPTLQQTLMRTQVAVRFHPFGRSDATGTRFELANLYIAASAGFAELDHVADMEDHDVARGFTSGAAVGWELFGGRDWTYLVELRDDVAFFNREHGVRNQFGVVVSIEVYLPW